MEAVPNIPGIPTVGPRHLRGALSFCVLAGAYVGAAKLGLELSVSHGVITPVWAPSGLSLAALLILGIRYWPAVAVGAFIANATSDAPLAVAAGIAVGNTLEAVVGATLVRRLGFDPALDRVRAVLALVVGGALASTAISATNGVSVLTLAGERQDSFGSAWVLWWFGDAVGDLMVAPLLLVLFSARRFRPSRAQIVEGAVLLTAIAVVGAGVFLGGGWRYPYLIFPLLLWATLRFRQLGATSSSFLVGALGTWGAVAGRIPIGADTATERVQVVQGLFVVITVSLLVVGATLCEREEGRAILLRTASSLNEAQALAHVGSWRWDIPSDVVTWSDELYRIFGLAPHSKAVSYRSYLERVHEDDRTLVDDTVKRAYGDRQPFSFEHRIVRPNGDVRFVSSRGQVIVEDGEPVAMLGTAQDITEQRQVERLREDILSAVSHELRTPLTSVLGFALTLQERRSALSEETIEEIVRELGAAARRLERLLTDLLDVERMRRGLVAVARQPVDVRALVEQVLAVTELDTRRVTVSGEPVVAHVDAAKLERTVENLVANAAKHTPAGSPIGVLVRAEEADLHLVVTDEGPGVADEFKEAVFEIFNRGPSVFSATPGAGIGLALVARFTAVHGGRCWVEDNPGGGASFHVLLPDCVLAEARLAQAGAPE